MSNEAPSVVFVPQASIGLISFITHTNDVYGGDVKYIRSDIADELIALLIELVDIEGPQPGTSAWADKVHAAIAKATEVAA